MTTDSKGSAKAEQPEELTSDKIANLSDEELTKALENPKPEDTLPPSEEEDKGEEPKAEDPKTEDEDEQPKDEDKQPEDEDEDEPKDPKKENAQLKKQLAHLQEAYGRQSNEVGQLRKALKKKPTADDFDENPVQAAEDLQKHNEQKKEIETKERSVEAQKIAIRNMQLIEQHAPDLADNKKAIRKIMAEVDDVDDGQIEKLFGNIYLHNPWGVYQLNERAKLYDENSKLKKELEDTKKKLKEAPTKTAQQISKASKMKSNVSASTGSSNPAADEPLNPSTIASLSDEELSNQLDKLQKG